MQEELLGVLCRLCTKMRPQVCVVVLCCVLLCCVVLCCVFLCGREGGVV